MIISPSAISPYKITTFQSGGEVPFSFGNALQFDGVNDYVSIPTIVLDGAFTISMWSKDVTVFDNPIIGDIGAGGWITYRKSVNRLRFNNPTIGTVVLNPIAGIKTNEWNHFFITRNAANSLTVIINGDTPKTGTINGTFTFTALGARDNLGGFNNIIQDEFAIWNTVLTPTDALNLYNSDNGDYATNYSPENLQAYWRMNGTSGDSTAIDEQGTYNGTLINFNTATCWVAH